MAIGRESTLRTRPRCGNGRWPLRNKLDSLGDCPLQLWVFASHIGLRQVLNLNRRVGPIILNAPANVVKPEAELWLRGDRSIGQCDVWLDADHAAPRAHTYQRPKTKHL